MRDKFWNLINSNIFSNTAAAIVGAGLSWQFSRSYREGDLKNLKEDLANADSDRVQLNHEVKDLERINRHLMSELAIKQSQLSDCRSNFRDSYCFWRQNTRNHYQQIGKADSPKLGK